MTDNDLDPTHAAALARATGFLELAELLQFLGGWLAADPDLATSLSRFVADSKPPLTQRRVPCRGTALRRARRGCRVAKSAAGATLRGTRSRLRIVVVKTTAGPIGQEM